MKTDSTGKIVEMKLDEIIDIYNSWTAVSDSLIVPAAIPNYLQTKQNYESILAKMITEVSRRGIDPNQNLPFAAFIQLMSTPVDPLTLYQAIVSLNSWLNLPDASETITAGNLRDLLTQWAQVKGRMQGFIPTGIIVRGKPVEEYENRIVNAISRGVGGSQAQVTFTAEESEAFQLIRHLIENGEELSSSFDLARFLRTSNRQASLSKQLGILRKRLDDKEAKLKQQFELLGALSDTVNSLKAEVEHKNEEVEKQKAAAATDPAAAILLPKSKQELEQKLNSLLVLNTQIKSFNEEAEKIKKEITLIQSNINEILVQRRKL